MWLRTNAGQCDCKFFMTFLHFQQLMLAILCQKKLQYIKNERCLLADVKPCACSFFGNPWSPHTCKFYCMWVTGDGLCAGSSACEVGPTSPGDSVSLLHTQSDHPSFSTGGLTTQAWRERPRGAQAWSSYAASNYSLSDAQQMCFTSCSRYFC